ncbi:hypothetical protein [Paraburkholderia fungorum]|uniref:hypothetical protein n=1 Tax=Paraburkholderia fungorum TaxID=134537 RepID=UPI0011C3968D|nr:hypothetical protein [Paraburkholderia fungorum]
MMRPLRPGTTSSGINPNPHGENGESKPAELQLERRRAGRKTTPEEKAKDVLKLERARQRTVIRHMQATHGEIALTTKVLLELLSDPAFVALLRDEGFTSMPKLLRQRLMERR